MSHLRRYLEQTSAVAPDKLEAALRRQQIYGGSLDTVLLELSVCDPQTLCELLGQACGLEIVRPELLENRPRPWDVVPDSLQDIGWAAPLAETEDNVLVAVHPDLPNERLGELYRAVPRVIPLVTPECGLEKVSAERTSSVVPQRYAVLFASFMGALRRRPSVSDVGFPIVPLEGAQEDTAVGPRVEAPPATPDPDPLDQPPNPDRVTQDYAERHETEFEIDASEFDVPEPPADPEPKPGHEAPEPSIEAQETRPRAKVVRPPSFGPPRKEPQEPPAAAAVQAKAPPVRFTARGTMISTTDPLRSAFDVEQARRGLETATVKLGEAVTRDEAIDALVEGALVFSDRVAVFRIRGDVLRGLTTPHPALAGIRDADVPLGDTSSDILRQRRWVGTTGHDDLAQAIGAADVPCTLHRIDVAGRPVLVLYVDHEGREFLPTEANLLDELCGATAAALETILRHRRSSSVVAPPEPEPEPEPEPPPLSFQPPPLESTAPEPEPEPEPEPASEAPPSRHATRPPTDDSLQPPPDYGITQPPGWLSPDQPPDVAGPDIDPASSMHRTTQVDGSPSADILPPVPEQLHRASAPRFVPPVLDDADDGGIIPLSSPIDQPTVRGRIMIEEDDEFDEQPEPPPQFDDLHAIEAALRAVAREEGSLDQLRALGEPALRTLAARIPGPLEVLRRDLRALPAPSAHGPLIRAAIRLGGEFVPFAIEQFNNHDPDVRFYAAFLFQELRDPRAMTPLSHLAFDGSTDVRVIAMRVLETYSRYDGFGDAAAIVRAELESTHRTHQLYAARAVGTLRDVEAIPKLIALLSSRDRFIQEASLESLCSITGQQHGLKPHRWKSWHNDQGARHRVEWIIESLRHRDLPVRRWAHDELVRVTGHRVPFSPLGDRSSREVAYQAWVEWWQRHGHARLRTRVSAPPT